MTAPNGFACIPHEWSRDKRLSLKAKGLLVYLFGHASGYQLTLDQIVAENADGERSVRSAMQELIDCGMVERTRARRNDGTLGGVRYTIVSVVVSTVSISTGQAHVDVSQSGSDLQEQAVSAGQLHVDVLHSGCDLQERDVSAGHNQDDVSQCGSDQGKHSVSAGGNHIAFQQSGADQGKEAVSAGRNHIAKRNVDTINKKNNVERELSPSERVTRVPARTHTRGTRLSDDFLINDSMLAWATSMAAELGNEAPPDASHFRRWLEDRTERFRDYWRGEAGQRAVKRDWVATWRNWMRREIEQAAAARPARSSALSVRGDRPAPRPSTSDRKDAEVAEARAKLQKIMNGER